MKKVIGITLVVMIILSACSNKNDYSVLEQIGKEYNKCCSYGFNALTVYTDGENYLITINENGTTLKHVVFSSQRECVECNGLDLIADCNINNCLNITFENIEKALGPHHVEIGSGFYIPSYLTKDAFLISFYLENGEVVSVVKRDLFTDEIIERAGDGSQS